MWQKVALAPWHFPPIPEQNQTIETDPYVLLGKRNCSLSFTPNWASLPLRGQVSAMSFMLHSVAFIAFSHERSCCPGSQPSLPENSMLCPCWPHPQLESTQGVVLCQDSHCPCFSSAPPSLAKAAYVLTVFSFFPFPHAAHQGDEQFRGIRMWWSWP